MIDRERTSGEREDIFEAARRSYRMGMENAFALQDRTLEFAQNLLESSAEVSRSQAERNRAMLKDLTEQSRKQREAMETLLRQIADAYVNLLWAPFSYYREAMEAMTPSGGRSSGSDAPPAESQASDLPLADYDSLNVRQINQKLGGLSVEEIEQLRRHEIANKNRGTLLKRFDARIEAGR